MRKKMVTGTTKPTQAHLKRNKAQMARSAYAAAR